MNYQLSCKRSGITFPAPTRSVAAYNTAGINLPLLSSYEHFRNLLACVPSLELLFPVHEKRFSNQDGNVHINIPLFSISESGNWIPVLEAIDGSDPMVERTPSPVYFLEQFKGLYREYSSLQVSPQSCYPVHYFCKDTRNSLDCFACDNITNSLECVFCSESDRIFFARNSHGCVNSYFIDSCVNCSNCLFCYGLKDVSYHICNAAVTKEEYQAVLDELSLYSAVRLESAKERFSAFLELLPVPAIFEKDSKGISGNFLHSCLDVDPGVFVLKGSHSSQIFCSFTPKHLVSSAFTGPGVSRSLLCMLLEKNVSDSCLVYGSRGDLKNCEYCIACDSSEYLLGCVGLSNKKYCILNRQYSREEFFKLRQEIVSCLKQEKVWGDSDIFRTMILPYNVSLANIFMPLGRIQAHLFGNIWKEDSTDVKVIRDIGSREDYRICEISGEPYLQNEYEKAFSQEFGVAIPERSPVQRFRERLESAYLAMPHTCSCPISNKKISSWYGGKRQPISNDSFKAWKAVSTS